jgi:type IV pilus assembly protein PilV
MLANLKSKSVTLPSGFTLLEVLITLIVLSVGLLGLAGLQTMSLRNNHDAYLRSQATIQAYDIVDRMRASALRFVSNPNDPNADPNAAQIARYTLTNSTYTLGQIGIKTAACDTTAGCTAAELAGHNLYKWVNANRGMLPQGIGVVCRDGSDLVQDPVTDHVGIEDGSYNLATDTVTTRCTNKTADPLVVKIWWVDDRTNDPPVASHLSILIGDTL